MHLRRVLALSLAVPLMFAGCTEEEPTPKIPDPTTSATPTPEETETVEEESAEEFIRRWQAAADQMVLDGDSREFLKMSKGCQACSTYAKQVSDVYDQGGSVEFGGSEVVAVNQDSANPPTYSVKVRAGRLRILVPGEEARVFPAATQRYRMILKADDSSFVMRNYSVI